jgi:CheY-like chemotaxis protein
MLFALQPNRVLVVEDDPTIRELYTVLLGDEGYRVETAVDGQDGLAQLRCQPDIILLDLSMPLMDGREFLRRLRLLPDQNATPVLVISATFDGASIAGAQGVMRKPFDALTLLAQMSGLLASPV